ncbi:MAG: SDR family oxidoreductase [Gammaproteobacteria bacterium]
MRRVLIVGATSAIAEAAARMLATRGDALYLVARNLERLESIATDLAVRGCSTLGFERLDLDVLDAAHLAAHEAMLDRAEKRLGGLDTVLIAHGTLSEQTACEQSVPITLREMTTNALSVVALLTPIANRFEARRAGVIAVISSVAGERGRQSNYVYGSAKAMVTAFLSGLRQRLQKSGVAVITVKPGFVDTPMTASFKKGPLWASATQVAEGIVRALEEKPAAVYLPAFWRPIMYVIRAIPEGAFSRLRL